MLVSPDLTDSWGSSLKTVERSNVSCLVGVGECVLLVV